MRGRKARGLEIRYTGSARRGAYMRNKTRCEVKCSAIHDANRRGDTHTSWQVARRVLHARRDRGPEECEEAQREKSTGANRREMVVHGREEGAHARRDDRKAGAGRHKTHGCG